MQEQILEATESSPAMYSNFYKSLTFLALPIILQELLNSGVNLLDSLMVGQLGLNAINGVGFANQIFFLFILLSFGIVSGASIFTGQFWGKGDISGIHKVMGISFQLCLAAAAVFVSGAIFFPHHLLRVFSAEKEALDLGARYLRVVAFSYFINAITITFNTALRSIGQTKIPMLTIGIAVVVNALLNYIFIFIFDWGVEGAAAATVLARLAGLCVQIYIIYKYRFPVGGKLKSYFTADKVFIIYYLKLATPVILNEFIWALGTVLYTVAYKYCGNEAQGSVQIASTVQSFSMVFGMSVGNACGIMLANLLGAEENETAVRYSRKCLQLGVLISAVMGAALFLLSPFIVMLYDVPLSVKKDAIILLRFISFGIIMKTFNFITIVAILRSGGDTKFCLIADGLAVWLIGVPMAFLGAYVLKLPIYFVLPMVYSEELFKVVITFPRVLSNQWAKTVV